MTDLAPSITPADLKALIEDADADLIDVRENHEWDAGRIPGARHVELNRLSEEAGDLGVERPVVFYCRVGNRSAMASEAFRASGRQATNLDGGIERWAVEGNPLDPGDGKVAH